jgi:hypothetical protein
MISKKIRNLGSKKAVSRKVGSRRKVVSKKVSSKKVSKPSKVCKEDEELNQNTKRCRKKCNENQVRDDKGRCKKVDKKEDSKKVSYKKVSSKKVSSKKVSSKKVSSKKVSSKPSKVCKEDEELNQNTKRCRKKCKENQVRDHKGRCKKVDKKEDSKPVSSKKVSSKKVSSKKVSSKKVSSKKVSSKKVSSKRPKSKKIKSKKSKAKKVSSNKVSSNEPSNKKECNICADTVSNNKFVSCPYCTFECCKQCMETFLLNLNHDTPRCMDSICKKTWSLNFVADNFSKSFFNVTYRNRRTDILLDREKSLLPEAQLIIQQRKRETKIFDLEWNIRLNERKYDNNEIEIKFLEKHEKDQPEKNKNLIKKLKIKKKIKDRIAELEEELRVMVPRTTVPNRPTAPNTVNNPLPPVQIRNIIIMKCPADNCRGFVNNDYICGLCNVSVCKNCRIIVEDKNNHRCNKDLVKTVKFLSKDTKNCPSCSTPIFKISGCDQMYCTLCHTAFSWTTGSIEKGVIHNPHYYQYMRENGGIPNQNIGNRIQQCGLGIQGIMIIINSLVKNKKIIDFLTDSHRMIGHIPYFIRNNTTEPNYFDLRIEFLQNEIDENKWKELIKRRQKIIEKEAEVNMIVEMVLNVSRDLFNEFDNSSVTPNGNRQNDDILLENINKLHTSIVNLHEYANEELLKIRNRYNNLTPIFFNGILFNNENSIPLKNIV